MAHKAMTPSTQFCGQFLGRDPPVEKHRFKGSSSEGVCILFGFKLMKKKKKQNKN